MTTASKPSGRGSPVSTTTNAPGSRNTGVLSLAPTVSAARTAMPSIAEASNDGDERVAHTGSAVTRPTASASPRRTVSTRSGQPAATHAARQAASASAAGTSWMKGVVAIAEGGRRGPLAYVYSVTSTSRPAGRPVASSGTTTNPSAAVSTDSRAEAPNSGVATPSRTATWTTSNRPAADGMSRSSRARSRGSGGGS